MERQYGNYWCMYCDKVIWTKEFFPYCSKRCYDIEEQSQRDEIKAEQAAADYLYGVRD